MPKRTRSAELAALTAIAAQVNCTQNLDEILKGALQTTVEVTGVDAAEIAAHILKAVKNKQRHAEGH